MREKANDGKFVLAKIYISNNELQFGLIYIEEGSVG